MRRRSHTSSNASLSASPLLPSWLRPGTWLRVVRKVGKTCSGCSSTRWNSFITSDGRELGDHMRNFLDTMLTRREVLKAGACSLSAYWFIPLVKPANVYAQRKVSLRGSARFVIFINLDGGQSHVDAWDLKEHKWTPQDFDIREVQPGVKWPMALYPNLAKQWDQLALVRSMEAWDSVHFRAQYYVQSGHMMNPALQKEIPPVGSVVAYEYAQRRRPTDTLPGYVAVNMTSPQVGLLKCGFLPATYTPFHVDTTVGSSTFSMDDDGRKEFMRRWELL